MGHSKNTTYRVELNSLTDFQTPEGIALVSEVAKMKKVRRQSGSVL